jgi:hypothetical protein
VLFFALWFFAPLLVSFLNKESLVPVVWTEAFLSWPSDGVNAVLTFTLYLLAAVMLAITLYATESRL